jgi:prepilin-type N-terminal cleavage/methylation domain-containing protein
VRKGVTLLEMLVVIGIIVALVGISFPVFRSSIQAAKRTEIISRLSQIYVATELYRADNNGRVMWHIHNPTVTGWQIVLSGYLSDKEVAKNPELTDTNRLELGTGFVLNQCTMGLADVETENPAFFFESAPLSTGFNSVYMHNSLLFDREVALMYPGYSPIGGRFLADYSSGGSTIVFWNGNVKWSPYKKYEFRPKHTCQQAEGMQGLFETSVKGK